MARAKANTGGLPIAAHLALMLALAFAAAFAAMVAVIIFLPPRPPQVVRGDQIIERFASGFEIARESKRPPPNDAMVWRISNEPPRHGDTAPGRMLGRQLAERLALPPGQVRILANSASAEFVYRVRDVGVHRMHMEGVEVIHGANGQVILRRSGEPDVAVDPRELRVRTPRAPPGEVRAPPAQTTVRGEVRITTGPTPRAPPEAPFAPRPPPPPDPVLFAPPAGLVLMSGFEIGAQLPDGHWLTMQQGRDWASIGWIGRSALAIGATLLMMTLIALVFARRLAKPIQGFADAVQAVGVDPQSASVDERGPAELRSAARAVNTMQARLRSLIADRTKTLATVAHDMRTPLMRLRLSAENAEPALRDKMAKEIGEVEALVASFISFARDDPAEEARVRIDLAALLQSQVDDHAALGRNASFEGIERLIITGQSLGLKRLFSNLIDNALKYGGAARVRLSQEGGNAVIDVEDDGPGIPAAERESVFKPFVRLTAAAGGAGLGLPAARSIARVHAGDIVILDSEHGARFRTTLPL